MTFFPTWEEFAKAAETLYVSDPMKVIAFLAFTFSSFIVSLRAGSIVFLGNKLLWF